MMNHLLTEPEARAILEPHLDTLKTIMMESLEALNRALGAAGESINNRGRANLFHSIAMEKAKRYFNNSQGISITTKYQSIQIVFDQKLIGRIKKVNKGDLSANAKTVRNQMFLSQQPDLFGQIPNLTCIDIGYKIQSTWTEFERLNIVCRLYDSIQWKVSYKEAAIIENLNHQLTTSEKLTEYEENLLKIRKINGQG